MLRSLFLKAFLKELKTRPEKSNHLHVCIVPCFDVYLSTLDLDIFYNIEEIVEKMSLAALPGVCITCCQFTILYTIKAVCARTF
jgi:hypothetical protein